MADAAIFGGDMDLCPCLSKIGETKDVVGGLAPNEGYHVPTTAFPFL